MIMKTCHIYNYAMVYSMFDSNGNIFLTIGLYVIIWLYDVWIFKNSDIKQIEFIKHTIFIINNISKNYF